MQWGWRGSSRESKSREEAGVPLPQLGGGVVLSTLRSPYCPTFLPCLVLGSEQLSQLPSSSGFPRAGSG